VRMTRWAAVAVLGIAAAVASVVPAGARAAHGHWQALLVAGDDAQPVFDDATAALAKFLAGLGTPADDIRRLSANPVIASRPGFGPAVADTVLQRIAALPARPGDRCLVFLTSHGEHGGGLYLAPYRESLTPAALAPALARGCAAVPTVVIVSGCYTGGFAAAPMTAPNRIILTASRADRPSFGCAVDRVYTFFDECLLGALPRSTTWRAVFDTTRDCVDWTEKRVHARPSHPQAWFGAAVGNLAVRGP
jgi:Peptidase C13 family